MTSFLRRDGTRRSIVRIETGISVVLAATLVFAAPAVASTPTTTASQEALAGGIGIRLITGTSSDGGDPQGQIYIVADVAPGATIHRQVQVSNATTSTAHIVLYPAAAFMERGSFEGAVGHTPNSVSTWTSIQPGSSDVASRGLLTADVTIAVPSTAPPGEEYGVIWAETRTTPSGDGIIQVSRAGIRIYLAVGAGGLAPANFSIGSLSADRSSGGQTTVHTSVQNTGGWPLDVSGTLQLSDGPGGLSAAPLAVRLGNTLSAGRSAPMAVALNNGIPEGRWHIRMSLQGGGLSRSVEATLTLPGTSTHSGWPLAAIVIVIGLPATMAFSIHLRRRRRRGSYRRAV